jgi:hypothetical protein
LHRPLLSFVHRLKIDSTKEVFGDALPLSRQGFLHNLRLLALAFFLAQAQAFSVCS